MPAPPMSWATYSPCWVAGRDIVGLDQRDELATGRGSIDRDDRDAGRVGGFDTLDDAGGVDGAHDDAVVSLGDRIFHLGDLIGHAGCIRQGDHVDRHTVFGGTGFDAFLQELPEGIGREDLHEGELVRLIALDRAVGGHGIGSRSGRGRILRGGGTELETSGGGSGCRGGETEERSSVKRHCSVILSVRSKPKATLPVRLLCSMRGSPPRWTRTIEFSASARRL